MLYHMHDNQLQAWLAYHRVQKTQYRIVPMEMFQLNMSKVTKIALHRNSAGK